MSVVFEVVVGIIFALIILWLIDRYDKHTSKDVGVNE
jgi:hypothetical protein